MRRDHVRYRAKGGALVAFSIPHLPPLATLRRLFDISKGGLSFCYIAREKQEFTATEVDLFWRSVSDAVVKGIPCRIAHDTGEGGEMVSYARFRRCGIEFIDLTSDQRSRLETFIRNCAQMEA